jgi:hypothetical protein
LEGDSISGNDQDTVDDIVSGQSNQKFKASSEDESIKVASNSSDSQDSSNINDESSSDNNSTDDSSVNDSSDDDFVVDDDMFVADSTTNSSTSEFNTSSGYAELDEFLALSNEVKELGNRIDMVSLELKETQQYMREGFAMSSALAAMPTPTNYGLNFSAGAGNYDGSNALAFGFVYVRENYVINVGHAKSDTGGKTMTNIGFTYNISSWFKK